MNTYIYFFKYKCFTEMKTDFQFCKNNCLYIYSGLRQKFWESPKQILSVWFIFNDNYITTTTDFGA